MIVDRISDLEGLDPEELSPPLCSVIEPEALDVLFRSSTGDTPHTSGHVRFEYRGYEIRVQSDGEIAVLNR
ncbi:HalOD1 output domain-containing protein [Halomicrobium urmianum]|uniref:HalOD1 output domain-containing protein n=1 Tax=Halomicrobium urmianum TaxID=1586233 RepID=UPI001CD970E7|nr:HalOD1 output domain-containing protein [Halomicrobium urmianum]